MPQLAARIGDPTTHGGVITTGFPQVLISGQPAARLGDTATCVDPPDRFDSGCPTVLVSG